MAPVTVGDGAIVGAGSVITNSVAKMVRLPFPAHQQVDRPKWADKLRAVRAAEKRAKTGLTAPDPRIAFSTLCLSAARPHHENGPMCGIIGIIGARPAAPLLLDALRRLEYRGYDSAGIATVNGDGHQPTTSRRQAGQSGGPSQRLPDWPAPPASATRAGPPMAARTKPMPIPMPPTASRSSITGSSKITGRCAPSSKRPGICFETETDTEVVVHLISHELAGGADPVAAAEAALKRLEGAFALAMIFAGNENLMIGARQGSPAGTRLWRRRDVPGLRRHGAGPTDQPDLLSRRKAIGSSSGKAARSIHDAVGRRVNREVRSTALSGALIGKAGYRHFMLKEIYEQPESLIGDTLRGSYVDTNRHRLMTLPDLPFDPATVPRVTLVACGTAWLRGTDRRNTWLEVDRPHAVSRSMSPRSSGTAIRRLPDGGVAIFISQSGETIDTLGRVAPLQAPRGQVCIGIVNVAGKRRSRGRCDLAST